MILINLMVGEYSDPLPTWIRMYTVHGLVGCLMSSREMVIHVIVQTTINRRIRVVCWSQA